MLDAGLFDSFRLFNDDGGHYSWWDYRQGAFRRNLGLRIDLIREGVLVGRLTKLDGVPLR